MNRVSSIFLKRCLLSVVAFLAAVVAAADPAAEQEPFSQDDASGRTVMSLTDGYGIVLSRFHNAPVRGSRAPTLRLFDPVADDFVELPGLVEKGPTVLVFGSYGCDVVYDGADAIRRCIEAFGDRMNFVFVYIREAHSIEAEEEAPSGIGNPVIQDPVSIEERVAAASKLFKERNLNLRVLIDTMNDEAATRWAAWPVRLYVVDERQTVVYSGKPGPWGFFPTPEQKAAGFDRMRPHEDRFNQESLYEFLESYLEGSP